MNAMTTGSADRALSRFLGTRTFFLAFLTINLATPFATHFYHTLDGPAHLYNAQLLKGYLLGDATVRTHFSIHPDPVPNWTDHGVLALLLCVFPAWLAEKLLVCGYIAVMALGFRKLVRTIAPENAGLSLLVFPLVHHELFNFGFYDFSIGLALMLWLLALEWEVREPWRVPRWSRTTLLATVLYFSNVLAFALTLFILVARRVNSSVTRTLDKEWRSRWLPLAGAFLPGSLCFLACQAHTHYAPSDPGRPIAELLTWLWDGRAFIAYGYETERPFAHTIVLALLALIGIRVFARSERSIGSGVLLLASLALLAAFLFVPDSFSAGMMNDRFAVMLFLFIALWLATSTPVRWLAYALALSAACAQLCLSYLQWSTARRELDLRAQQVEQAGASIPAGATVYPVLLSDNWLHAHISNYLGADKPMIILENYEARLGWFPLRWREGRPAQRCLAGTVPYGVRCDANATELPDHVVLIGDTTWLSRPDLTGLRDDLRAHYTALPTEPGFVAVYRKQP